MAESTNSEESSNAIVQVDVHHRHFSQLGASIVSTNNVCVTEDQATNDISSIECGYPKTTAERMREYRARKKKENPIVKYRRPKKSGAQRVQECRARKKAKAQSVANNIGILIEDQTMREQIQEQKSQSQNLFVSRSNQESENETNYPAYADFHRHLLADALKKKEKVKTPAERSREYRARKKALKNSNQETNSTSETIQEMQENSLSEYSQDSDSCPNISNKRKTPADYSREYRARKKALKNFQKQSDSDDCSLNPVIKPKTPAERSRDYRARKKAYMDLEKPIPIALSIDMVKSKKSCTVNNFSILPDNINDISNDQNTSNCNNNVEEFQDSGTDLHDMLHHMHNYISNKLTEEILTDTEIKKEVCDTEINENIQADYNEHVQIKTEYIQSPITDPEIEYQIEDKHIEMIEENEVNVKKRTDSVNGNVEFKLTAPEISVNNIYDHVIEIKQEIPCEFTNFDEDHNIDCGALNNGTNLQEDFRIKCESESFKDT